MRAACDRWSRLGWPLGFVALGIVLCFVYYLQSSRDAYVNSDGASNALQAWAMLHGNVLLHGWTVSDVSFYTTELPQYVVVEAIRGLNSDVVHICGAMTYTLLVLLAAWLAKGDATGRRAVTSVLIAIGIMLAPQLGNPTGMLLLSPDHVGTGVPLLVAWLLVDRVGGPEPGRHRWLVPVAVGVILAWTAVGDQLAEVIGAVPLAFGCALRVIWVRWRRQVPLRDCWYELSLGAAAVLSVPAAWLGVKLIVAAGGWTITAPRSGFATASVLGRNAALTGTGLLQLFGADFPGQPTVTQTAFAVIHLAGLALAAWALFLALRRFFAEPLIVQVLVIAIVVNLAAYMFTVQAESIATTREIAAVLPFGAVLAGRLLPGQLFAAVARPGWLAVAKVSLAVLLVGNVIMLGYDASQTQPVPGQVANLAHWLAEHKLTSGLGGYWQSNGVTLDSGGTVMVRAIDINGGKLTTGAYWEADSAWYDRKTRYANFIVDAPPPWHPDAAGVLVSHMEAIAGKPAKVYHIKGYTIAVWHKNLLGKLA
jgi:hypothetical protein